MNTNTIPMRDIITYISHIQISLARHSTLLCISSIPIVQIHKDRRFKYNTFVNGIPHLTYQVYKHTVQKTDSYNGIYCSKMSVTYTPNKITRRIKYGRTDNSTYTYNMRTGEYNQSYNDPLYRDFTRLFDKISLWYEYYSWRMYQLLSVLMHADTTPIWIKK